MSAIDAINNNNIFAMYGTQSVNPFVQGGQETPKVGQVEKTPEVKGGSSLAGFKATKWQDGLGGIPAGQPLGENAVYTKGLGGKEGRAGARLNVDAFSIC